MTQPKHKAIIGLGNPGPEYRLSPHNAGYAVVDRLAIFASAQFSQTLLPSALTAEITAGDINVTLVKPTTGMNSSGLALKEVLEILGLDFPEILVVFDDLSLPLGKLRFRENGRQHAGHNGVKSLFEHVPEIRLLSRLKIGVGPDPGGDKRYDYVTSPMPDANLYLFGQVTGAAVEAAVVWAVEGLGKAMNKYNSFDLTGSSTS